MRSFTSIFLLIPFAALVAVSLPAETTKPCTILAASELPSDWDLDMSGNPMVMADENFPVADESISLTMPIAPCAVTVLTNGPEHKISTVIKTVLKRHIEQVILVPEMGDKANFSDIFPHRPVLLMNKTYSELLCPEEYGADEFRFNYPLSEDLMNIIDSLTDPLLVAKLRLCLHSFRSLQGKEVRVVYNGFAPYMMYNLDSPKPGGVDASIIEMAAEELGFIPSYKYVEPQGNLSKPEHLVQGLADISMGGNILGVGWAIAATPPLYVLNGAVFYQKPPPVDSVFSVFRPFKLNVWVPFMTMSVLFGSCFLVVYLTYSKHSKFLISHRPTYLADFFINCFAAITEPDPLPWFGTWSAGRLLILAWSLYATFMTMFYTSNLRANLIMPETEKPIRSAEEAVERELKVYIPDYVTNTFWYEHPRKALRDIYRIAQEKGGIYSTDAASNEEAWVQLRQRISDTVEGRAGFSLYEDIMMYWGKPMGIGFYNTKFFTTNQHLGAFHTQKHWPKKAELDSFLTSMSEAGILHRRLRYGVSVENLPQREKSKDQAPPEPIETRALLSPLLIWSLGLGLTCAIFLIERFYPRCLSKQEQGAPPSRSSYTSGHKREQILLNNLERNYAFY